MASDGSGLSLSAIEPSAAAASQSPAGLLPLALSAAARPTDIILDVVVRADFGEELDDHETSFLGREVHGGAALVVRDVEVGAAVLGWTNEADRTTQARNGGRAAQSSQSASAISHAFTPPRVPIELRQARGARCDC